jgi:hypothetical protein
MPAYGVTITLQPTFAVILAKLTKDVTGNSLASLLHFFSAERVPKSNTN